MHGWHLFEQVSSEIMVINFCIHNSIYQLPRVHSPGIEATAAMPCSVIFFHALFRVNSSRHICLCQNKVNGAWLLDQERVYLQL